MQTVSWYDPNGPNDSDFLVAPVDSGDGSRATVAIVDKNGNQLATPLAFQGGGGIIQIHTYITPANLGLDTAPATQHPNVVEF